MEFVEVGTSEKKLVSEGREVKRPSCSVGAFLEGAGIGTSSAFPLCHHNPLTESIMLLGSYSVVVIFAATLSPFSFKDTQFHKAGDMRHPCP